MKKIVSLIIMFFNLCNFCSAKDLQFIQVTDVHLTQQNAKYLKDFVQEINSKYTDIDFVVFTGDNIDKANPEDLLLFLKIIKHLNARPYVLVGNHDLFKYKNLTKDTYMSMVRKELGYYHSDKANYVIKKGNIVFVSMNGVKQIIPDPYGYFREDELEWLDKTLTKYKNKKVVILQHFPLIDSKSTNHNLYKKEEYERILSKHNNVISIISGHYHKNIEQRDGNIYHIVTKNFANNTCYKLIEIDKDNMIYTYLIDKSVY